MKRAEVEAAFAAARAAEHCMEQLAYLERLPSGASLSIDVSGIPHAPPRLVVLDRGHHPTWISELGAIDLERCLAVKKELDAWWLSDGAWPRPARRDR